MNYFGWYLILSLFFWNKNNSWLGRKDVDGIAPRLAQWAVGRESAFIHQEVKMSRGQLLRKLSIGNCCMGGGTWQLVFIYLKPS